MPERAELRSAFAGQPASEIVFVAQQFLQAGAWDHALALCEACETPDDAAVLLCRSVASFVGGDAAAALALVERVLARDPEHLSARAVKAQLHARAREKSAALVELSGLLERFPDYPGAQALFAQLLLPGPHYREVLARIHERLRPRVYFEIGVESGATLALARHSERVLGVDPAPHALKFRLPPGARVVHEESDAFFATRTRDAELGALSVELGFIDGMHRFENALSDFIHLEAWSSVDGCIVFHDCLPLSARSAARERSTNFWVGDTWKVVFALHALRPDLKIRTLPCAPSGLVVVRRLNPGSSRLAASFQDVVARFASLEWTYAPAEIPAEFGPLSNDERGLEAALS